ncbi:putative cysteine--tRNA ligase [Teladorsagia circumcincta]|uniref:Cysteine--tRNA ligase, cytoplasmic n=2 Tax=Teladorsagia circumcincta TaxID=45464 RepID=A0A2G9UC89_TELCI|nr:putative cysteine--tRNA ligase [Teladorsagia circumcincta]
MFPLNFSKKPCKTMTGKESMMPRYESEFLSDMARLNVLPADVVTRVSEYVPEIVAYVEKIIENGYAYTTSDGSVYFDTKAFESNPKHFYAKLVPEAYGDSESLEKNMREGEGELSMTADRLVQKRNPSDFALWKSSKEGEPFWESPWGKGRPGWHIECSVMSTAICGDKLDIHAGGFDLKFPHHDNEIAQIAKVNVSAQLLEKALQNNDREGINDAKVYFDTKAFESNPKHFYAKLVPEAYGDSESLEKNMREGEGELSMTADRLVQKRNPSDFALWKSSKEGEPFWESPWGKGRPGWHIECSVMSTAICGDKLDIHAGGFDLKFPHHDNEIAQVEAYYDNPQWVNYFIHCGTLRIAGMKMSKSLKNFITIREALQTYTSRQLRFLFLMHNWTDVLDYSTATMERAMQFEKISNEFFLLVKDLLRKHYKPDSPQGYVKYTPKELQIMEDFSAIKKDEKEGVAPNCLLLRNIAAYMTDLFAIFGVIPKSGEIGFPIEREAGVGSEEMLMPYLNALASFREKVRNIAKDNKVTAILEECDRLRDDVLPELGVRLEDRTQETVVKLCDRDILLKEREQKRAIEAARREEKERKAAEKAEKEALKRIPPQEMFCRGDEAAKYSKWDENGIPTHTADGEEVR